MTSVVGCLSCDIDAGRRDLPGGMIHNTAHWNVTHCLGPLGVGTLIVKPIRHVLSVAELHDDELAELGPLLGKTASVVRALCEPDQIYVCLWSHAGGEPVHIHFVVQPVAKPKGRLSFGPTLQLRMFLRNRKLPRDEVEAFAERARPVFGA